MHYATLNIGHEIPGSDDFLHPGDILNVLRGYCLTIVASRVAHSATERTSIIKVSGSCAQQIIGAVYQASVALGQDCIAVQPLYAFSLNGLLVGPNAGKWGKFDSAFFLTLEG